MTIKNETVHLHNVLDQDANACRGQDKMVMVVVLNSAYTGFLPRYYL